MIVSLGLDLSVTAPGIVVLGKENGVRGHVVLHSEEMKTLDAKTHVIWDRASHIVEGVRQLVGLHPPSIVVIEGYAQSRHGNVHAFVKQAVVGSLVRHMLHGLGLSWVECPPTSLKLFVTGKGTADKKGMINGVLKHWEFSTKSHNVADGFGLAVFGLARLGAIPVRDWQVSVLDRVESGG